MAMLPDSAPLSCVHHWLLGDPKYTFNGSVLIETCFGFCKKCGATRGFENTLPPDVWAVGDAVPQRRLPKGFTLER